MSLKESALLVAAAVVTGIAIVFAAVGLATPRWLADGTGLWNCDRVCSTTGAALAIIGLSFLTASIISMIILLIRLSPRKLRFLPLALLILATLFLLATTAGYLRSLEKIGYSFELMVVAHAMAFLASVLLAFWLGTTVNGSPLSGTKISVIAPSAAVAPAPRVL